MFRRNPLRKIECQTYWGEKLDIFWNNSDQTIYMNSERTQNKYEFKEDRK